VRSRSESLVLFQAASNKKRQYITQHSARAPKVSFSKQ
jgi:hypothetical protein